MRIDFNYTKEGLFQVIPLLLVNNDKETAILLGFGKMNIALVFGNNDEKHKKGGEVKNGDYKEFTFIYYKKSQVNNSTHYTQPYRIKIGAKTKQEAVDKCIDFAMKSMKLVVVEEKDYDKSELGKISTDFNNLNKRMNDIFKDTDNWYKGSGFNQVNNNPYNK